MKEYEKFLKQEEEIEIIPIVEVVGERENAEIITVFPLHYTQKLNKHSIDYKTEDNVDKD